MVEGSPWDYYVDADAAMSDDSLGNGEQSILQTIVDSSSSQTLKFYWKVSSELNCDYLEFYIDGTRQDRISGEVDWTLKSYSISSGIHTLKWVYIKDSNYDEDGDDCGWVDFVQWTGYSPVPDSDNWQQLDYKYDVYGRRSEKIVDGYATRFCRDGSGSVLAEYDGNNNLLRKYVAGPGGPVCMIEVGESETYYYHYDGSGNVIALSDSTGDTVQTYEYSVFGRVAAEDANHPNPYMFGGMRFEPETGLYFTGGPVYSPNIGRNLQQNHRIHWELYSRGRKIDDVGEEENSGVLTFVRFADSSFGFIDMDEGVPADALWSKTFTGLDDWTEWAAANPNFGFGAVNPPDPIEARPGYRLADGDMSVFWQVQALIYLGHEFNCASIIKKLDKDGVTITLGPNPKHGDSGFDPDDNIIYWKSQESNWDYIYTRIGVDAKDIPGWTKFPPLVILAHEIGHSFDDNKYEGTPDSYWSDAFAMELFAVKFENIFRYKFYIKVPGHGWVDPRPVYGWSTRQDFIDYFGVQPHDESAMHDTITWDFYFRGHFEHGPVMP